MSASPKATVGLCWSELAVETQRCAPLKAALEVAIPVEPLSLAGRQGAIAALQARIARGDRAVVLWGEGGIGKTTLAQAFLDGLGCDRQLEVLMAKDSATLTAAEQIVEEWLRQDFQAEPGRDFGITLARLKRQLREQRVAILIDNLESALDGQGRFWPEQSGYGELLRILCDPKAPTITVLTSRDRLCEPGLPVTHYRLPGIDASARILWLILNMSSPLRQTVLTKAGPTRLPCVWP